MEKNIGSTGETLSRDEMKKTKGGLAIREKLEAETLVKGKLPVEKEELMSAEGLLKEKIR